MLVTPHFHASEFASPRVRDDGSVDRIDREPVPPKLHANLRRLCEQLEVVRHEAGDVAVTIVSGYRTKAFNARNPGRAPRSRHLTAEAADIRIKGMTPAAVYWLIRRLIQERRITLGGLACYRTFVHYDVRGFPASWRPAPPRPTL